MDIIQTVIIDYLEGQSDMGLIWIKLLHTPRSNPTNMPSFTRNSARTSEARQPDLHRFARGILVLAWAVFWLNTALFPCCEVAAAVLGEHADNGSQSVSAAQPAHHSDATHSEPLDRSPNSPCGYTLISGPPLVGEYGGVLTPDRSPLEWFAVDAPVATSLTAVNHSAILALARATPPPSIRLYLRTQRLLI